MTQLYPRVQGLLLGGWAPRTRKLVIRNNHGDRCRPLRIGLWDPKTKGPFSSLINEGYEPLTSPGMILQVTLERGIVYW